MTVSNINELLKEIVSNDLAETHLRDKQCRRRRRFNRIRKQDRLLRIVQLDNYAPQRGYIDYGYTSTTLLRSGKYIKYPKNSSYQHSAKRLTSRRFRRASNLPAKGNHYRRLFDYYWIFY